MTLPRKQNGHPIGYIALLSIILPLKRGVQRLRMLIYSLLTMAMLAGPLMGIKNHDKVRNWHVTKSQIVLIIILLLNCILVKFISLQLIHGCRYCSTNNTNEWCLLVSMCFWVKKELTQGQISLKNNSIRSQTSVFVFLPQRLHHTDDWIASVASFISHNNGNYVLVYTHFISH